MAMKMSEAIEAALTLVRRKRLRSAVDIFDRMRNDAEQASWKLIVGYQLGVVFWSEVGDGEAARRCFVEAIRWFEKDPSLAGHKATSTCYANACENMMVLALSFEEYEEWADSLAKVQPKNHNITHQRPKILEAKQRGVTWAEVMESSAPSYYNRNNSGADAGRYGCAASLWQLLLRHRSEVELAFNDWGSAVYEHSALTMRIASQAIVEMQKREGIADSSEALFVVEPSLAFVDEYLEANPSDPVVKSLREQLVALIAELKEGTGTPSRAALGPGRSNSPIGPTSIGGSKPVRVADRRLKDPPMVRIWLFLTALGGAGGWLTGWIADWPHAWLWGLGIGAGLASVVSIPLGVNIVRTSICAACNRRLHLARQGMEDELGSQCQVCLRVWCGECSQKSQRCGCGSNKMSRVYILYE